MEYERIKIETILKQIICKYDIDYLNWGTQYSQSSIWLKQNGMNMYKIHIDIRGKSKNDNTLIENEIIEGLKIVGYILVDTNEGRGEFYEFVREYSFKEEAQLEMERKAKEEMTKPSVGNQYNGNVTVHGGLNSGNNIETKTTTNNSNEDEKWFQKEVVKMILSFISGVAATIVAQLIWKYLSIM